jgi:hypothetical protein
VPLKVVGVDDVARGLEVFSDDLQVKIARSIRSSMLNIADTAKGYVIDNSRVLSGWTKPVSSDVKYRPFPKYDAENIRKGIGYNDGKTKMVKNGFEITNYVYNASPGGAIYETAGRLNPQGRAPFMSTGLKQYGGVVALNKPSRSGSRQRGTGSYNSNNPFAGYQFVSALPDTLTKQPRVKGQRVGQVRKSTGRLVYRAFAEKGGKVYDAIARAINDQAVEFNKNTAIREAA